MKRNHLLKKIPVKQKKQNLTDLTKVKFYLGIQTTFGSKKYNTFENARGNAIGDDSVGGITKLKKHFTLKKGRELKKSKKKDVKSWFKKLI